MHVGYIGAKGFWILTNDNKLYTYSGILDTDAINNVDYFNNSSYVTKDGELFLEDSNSPLLKNIKSIAFDQLAVTKNDELYGWDYADNPLVGGGAPQRLGEDVRKAIAGNDNWCYITNESELYTWGLWATTGDNDTEISFTDKASNVRDADTNDGLTIYVTYDNELYKFAGLSSDKLTDNIKLASDVKDIHVSADYIFYTGLDGNIYRISNKTNTYGKAKLYLKDAKFISDFPETAITSSGDLYLNQVTNDNVDITKGPTKITIGQ
jgi:hypothetical protein